MCVFIAVLGEGDSMGWPSIEDGGRMGLEGREVEESLKVLDTTVFESIGGEFCKSIEKTLENRETTLGSGTEDKVDKAS
jgi:hypothetical protein